jgi:hypothetical protein
MLHLIRTTVIGGILFLVPIVNFATIIGKTLTLTQKTPRQQ